MARTSTRSKKKARWILEPAERVIWLSEDDGIVCEPTSKTENNSSGEEVTNREKKEIRLCLETFFVVEEREDFLIEGDDSSVGDDGKLSFDEFKAYFTDGVLNAEEMHELFRTIDSNNTDNLNIEEICEYFSQHLGEYENVLAALEDLNISILKAMDKTKKDYQDSCNLEQFVTRFLLKETVNQLQSLQNSLECAMETTEEQTRQERQGPVKPEVLSINWSGKRSSRRLQRTNSLSPNNTNFSILNSGVHADEDIQWMTQINRLQKLIDRLEKKDLKLEPLEEEILEGNAKSHILIVQRQMSILEEELEEFRLALRQYVVSATAQTGCLHVSVQKLSSESRFTLYEFWENTNLWKNHIQTNYSKTFQRNNVDFLDTPELITTMLVPASWWVLNNN
ncbi:N-terminal EF-hand calcium-binding protein 1-like [Carcharodon carcharias]|uniref:N-terminal EF-hand calcium-binding protein 1-like n=1 Tax=Carcharodon carcharias TaxID=13397 RepID=UPI001B7E54A9|nr:N-terminal EF-hand calcium-binding protein 1-like [Carcharodon carcharias]